MAIVGVAEDVAVEDRKRPGAMDMDDVDMDMQRKKRVDVVLVVTMAVTGESGTFLQAGWPDGENWKTKIGCLSNLSNRGCSSLIIFCW